MTTLLATRDPDCARRFDRALAARNPLGEIGRYEIFTSVPDADGHCRHIAVARGYLAALRQYGCAPAMGGPVLLRHYRVGEPERMLQELIPYWREHLALLNRLGEPESIEEHFDIGPVDDGVFLTSRYFFGVDLRLLAAWCGKNHRNLPWSVGDALFRAGRDVLARIHSNGWSGMITARRIRICLSGANAVIVMCCPLPSIAEDRLVAPPALNSQQNLANLARAIARLLPIPVAEIASTETWAEDRALVEQLLRMTPIPSSLPLLQALVGDPSRSDSEPALLTNEEAADFWAAVKSASTDMELLAK